MNHFDIFLRLHHSEKPLLLANVWDVSSARVFEKNGFKAAGTSSRALAQVHGYEDGEKIPFELVLHTVKEIVAHIQIPLSVDMETGYGLTNAAIIQNIEKLHDLGAVGINLEDSILAEPGKLKPADQFQKTISSIRNHLEKKNMRLFINARTDTFLHKLPSMLEETIRRIVLYEQAGADGIFVPFIQDPVHLKTVVQATKLPVNIVCTAKLCDIAQLSASGVKRISMGPFLFSKVYGNAATLAKSVIREGSLAAIL